MRSVRLWLDPVTMWFHLGQVRRLDTDALAMASPVRGSLGWQLMQVAGWNKCEERQQ